MKRIPTLLLLGSLILAQSASARAADVSARLAFRPAGDEFTFDTGQLTGRLRAEKRGFGLTGVRYTATGMDVSRSTGLLGVYRVFGNGQRFGNAAWEWPSKAVAQPDGAVTVICAPTPDRPFGFQGTYRWVSPLALDLEIQVRPEKDLNSFEAFVSSYFDPAFTNALAYVKAGPQGRPGFLRAQPSLGEWLMFPRDPLSAALIQDGRWTLPPNPVKWTVVPELEAPVGIRRAPAATFQAAVMAPARDAFALAMPFETEGHYSMYVSTFGRHLKQGETAQTKVRLQFFPSADDAPVASAYGEFKKSL